MTTGTGTVGSLWRFPVKSMLGEQPDSIELVRDGVVGDRAHALIDTETGKVLSAKHPRKWPLLLQCRARYDESPAAGAALPAVHVTFPDGTTVTSDDPDVDAVLTAQFGHPVTLATTAPADFTIDDYHPDVEGLGPDRQPDTVSEARLGAAFFADAGLPSAVAEGSFLDLFPVSLITTSTLAALGRHAPETQFDPRRFRMNIVLDTPEQGFLENEWLGQTIAIGDAAVTVMIPDPRCVMTTLPQEDLAKDNAVLQTLARHNRVDVAGQGLFPCAGVYAVVSIPGVIRRGAQATLDAPA